MPKCFMDNILKGVLCACVIASGCGMNKGNKDELETILNDFFRKNTWWSNEENRGDLLRKIKNMTLSELAGSGFECVRKLKKGIFRFDDSCWPIETIDLKKDYIRNDDIFRELTSLNTLAKDLKIKSVQDLKGKTFEFNYDCCPKEEINLEDYVKKGNLENYDLTTLAKDLKIKAVGELEGKIFEFYYRENCLIKHEINLNDYVKKLELKNKDLNQLATGFEIFRVQNLQGGTFTFSDNYEATEVDLEGYVRKGDLEKGSLFSLGDLYGVDAVAKLNELETDGGVKIFNNYVFNDEVKGLVKKKDDINLDNYIEKEKLKGLEIDNVKLFNEGNYELTDDAQKLVKKDGYIKKDDVGNNYIEKEKLKGLEIDNVKLFNEEFVLTADAQALVKKDSDQVPMQTSGGCCRYK